MKHRDDDDRGRRPFKYRGASRTTESIVRRAKQSSGMWDSYVNTDVQSFKVKEGEVQVRILPGTWEDLDKYGDGWEVGIWVHFGVGPDEATYLCLEKMKEETCPVCEARRTANDPEEASKLKPTWRALCWVIDRDSEKAGPQLWAMPAKLFREINARSVDKKTNEALLIDNPDEGYDVTFTRVGTDRRTDYTAVEIDRDPSPLHEKESKADQWLDYIEAHPLPDMLVFYDAEHIEKVLYGKAASRKRKEEDEEDEAPSRRARARPSKDEDEEEETPRRRPARRASEDEEEEDSPPSRRRPSRDEEEDEPAPRKRPERRRLKADDEEEENPDADEEDEPTRGNGHSEEDAEATEDEEGEPGEGEPKPERAARGQLRKLRRLSR